MKNPPYLIATIPSKGEKGYVAIIQPGAVFGELEVIALTNRLANVTDPVVWPNLISVACDSTQVDTVREGRAMLALYLVDTSMMSPEKIQENIGRLLRRLDIIGSLARDESVKNSRDGSIVASPLLLVWSDHEGFDELPALKRPGILTAVSTTKRSLHARAAVEDPLHPVARESPNPRIARALGVAAIAMLALFALGKWYPTTKPPVEPEKSETFVAIPPPSSTEPRLGPPNPAPTPALIENPLMKDLDTSFNAPTPPDLLDKSNRELFDQTWAKRIASESDNVYYERFEQVFKKALEFTSEFALSDCKRKVDSALQDFTDKLKTNPRKSEIADLGVQQIENLIKKFKELDQWIDKHRTNGPLSTSKYSNDITEFTKARRQDLRKRIFRFLVDEANAFLGNPRQEPPCRWNDLKRLVALHNSFDELSDSASTIDEDLQRLKRVSLIVKDLDARDGEVLLTLDVKSSEPGFSPFARTRWPRGTERIEGSASPGTVPIQLSFLDDDRYSIITRKFDSTRFKRKQNISLH